ncbi:MAG: sulfite exporter TauE/SafE family protein [Betaproteobacteria bacterium]|nr:MAG: sulfite exporter TauE/SafE family protein [Betaproteobacteria bacterium]
MDWTLIPVFVAIGCIVGFIAGLLGIGGGMTMIPLLTLIFSYEHFPPEHILHISVATSMATIVFTSISSVRAHNVHKAVLWPVFWRLSPGILIGSMGVPLIISGMSTSLLALIFGIFAAFTATGLLRNRKPKATRDLPGSFGLFVFGLIIGGLSSMVGAGGGFISVPFLTSIAGLRHSDLPPYTVGYIYLPALVAIAGASVLVAPAGVRLAHRWPVANLRRAFAALLYLIAAFFFWKALQG